MGVDWNGFYMEIMYALVWKTQMHRKVVQSIGFTFPHRFKRREKEANLLLCQWYSWWSINKSNVGNVKKGNEMNTKSKSLASYHISTLHLKPNHSRWCWRETKKKKREPSTLMATALRMKTSIDREKTKRNTYGEHQNAQRRTFAFNRCHIAERPNEI